MVTNEVNAAGGSSPSSRGAQDELTDDAAKLKDRAKDRARQEAETRKGEATQAAKSASSALDKAAEELQQDENAPEWLSSAFRQTASSIQRFASNVEGRGADDIGRDITRFARQNPTAFMAASAAAGFAAARFLRTGAEYQHHHRSGSGNEDFTTGRRGEDLGDAYGEGTASSGFSSGSGESRFSDPGGPPTIRSSTADRGTI